MGSTSQFWALKARWHKQAGDDEDSRLASIAAAETHVKEAQKRLEVDPIV
jgi:hypothetical protein